MNLVLRGAMAAARKRVRVYNVGQIDPEQGPDTLESIPNKPENSVRFVVLSDTHEKQEALKSHVPNGDVLLHAGDFTLHGKREKVSISKFWKMSLMSSWDNTFS